MTTQTATTEDFIHAVRRLVVDHAVKRGTITDEEAFRLNHTKLLYGVGNGTYRGVCIYNSWQNGVGKVDIVEIAATGQESWTQIAGTVVHELGHVLAGHAAGHGSEWKEVTKRLGFLIRPAAAGQTYCLAMMERNLRQGVADLARSIGDGRPEFKGVAGLTATPRPCSAGTGSRGGTSRGKGSGSRMLKVVCETTGYTLRTTNKWLEAYGAPYCPCCQTRMTVG